MIRSNITVLFFVNLDSPDGFQNISPVLLTICICSLSDFYPHSDLPTPYLSPIPHLLYPQSCNSKIIYNPTAHRNIQDTSFLRKYLETGWRLMNACVGFYLVFVCHLVIYCGHICFYAFHIYPLLF